MNREQIAIKVVHWLSSDARPEPYILPSSKLAIESIQRLDSPKPRNERGKTDSYHRETPPLQNPLNESVIGPTIPTTAGSLGMVPIEKSLHVELQKALLSVPILSWCFNRP